MNNNICISAPASKSFMQRAMMISLLAKGRSVLRNVSWCDDSKAVLKIIKDLGANTVEKENALYIDSQGVKFEKDVFSVGESGLAARMLSPLFALSDKRIKITGEGSLLQRPLNIVADALGQIGGEIHSNNGYLPLTIKGPVHSGRIVVDGSLSSQLLSGLLIVLPLLEGDSVIHVENLKSIPYINMTLSVMEHFGVSVENCENRKFNIYGNRKYHSADFEVEGDWSGASFFLVLGAILGNVKVLNLKKDSLQADRAIVTALERVGARLIWESDGLTVINGSLKPFEFDATGCPDLFPPLACLASQCEGVSAIKGVSRLYHKESNRAMVIQKEFGKAGVEVEIANNIMYIKGGDLRPAVIDSHNDHRIAMAAGVLRVISGGKTDVINEDCVTKSYPLFFKEIEKMTNMSDISPKM